MTVIRKSFHLAPLNLVTLRLGGRNFRLRVLYMIHPSFRATPDHSPGLRDPESRKIANLDTGFRRHDDVKTSDLFCELLGRDTSWSQTESVLAYEAGGNFASP